MLEHDFSPLAASLIDTPPADLSELFQQLEDYYDSTDSLQIELAALLNNKRALSRLLEGSEFSEKVAFLSPHLQEKEGGDFLRLWNGLDSLEAGLRAAKVYSAIQAFDQKQITELVTEMARIPDLGEGLDTKMLLSGFDALRKSVTEKAEEQNADQFAFSFLRSLTYDLMGVVECSSNFWEILLLKLEQCFLPEGMHPEMSPLFPCFRIAFSNIPNQPALYEFCLLSEEVEEGYEAAANIACLTFTHAAPSVYRRSLFSGLDAQFFYSLQISGPFSEKTAPWRSALHSRLERSFADMFIDAADGALKLQQQLSHLINESAARTKISKVIAADLSQGMKAGNVSKKLEDNCQRLMNAAACAHLIGKNVIEAKDLFIPSIVSGLGVGPRVEIWRKHAQLLSRLAEATKGMESALDWEQISRLFGELNARIQEMHGRPVNWADRQSEALGEGLGLSDEELKFFTHLGELTAARIAIDERRYGTGWRKTIKLWLVDQLFSQQQKSLDFDLVETFLVHFFENIELEATPERPLDVEYLKGQARLFASGLLRVAAASSLYRSSLSVATSVADDVIESLPDYGQVIGSAGRESCIADNRITLLKVIELILESDEDPAEQLTEWWTSLVGSYLATRPESLFRQNLNALYRNISKNLSDAHTDVVFAPIQAMYNESLGVRCMEALASRPLIAVGSLAEQYDKPQRYGAWDGLLQPCPELFAGAADIAGLEATVIEPLSSLFYDYHCSLWRAGSADIAAARVLPALNRLELNGQASALASVLRSGAEALGEGKSSLLLQTSAQGFADLLLRSSIAEQIDAHAADIALYYSNAMTTYAPEYFEHLSKEDAIAKCSRDQVLLYQKIAQLFRRSTPDLAWFDLTRYFLELQSAFVDYPERIWSMSFRTLSKALGKHLKPAENLILVKLVDLAELLAGVWCSTQKLAKACFDPTDYAFSAKAETDRVCRDLLTAVLVGDALNRRGADSCGSFFRRFFLSSSLSSLNPAEQGACFKVVGERAAAYLSPSQVTLLESLPATMEAFVSAYTAAGSNLEGIAETDRSAAQLLRLALAAQEGTAVFQTEGGHHAQAVANILQRAHLACASESTAEAPAHQAFSARLNGALLDYLCSLDPMLDADAISTVLEALKGLKPVFAQDDCAALRLDECRQAVGRTAESARLIANSEAEAAEFLSLLAGGKKGTYNPGGEACKDTTDDSFSYVFKTAAAAALDPSLASPKLFFSRATENHRLIDLAVSANAHAKTCLRLAELIPGSALSAFAAAGDLLPVKGTNWAKVAYSSPASHEPALLQMNADVLDRIFSGGGSTSASMARISGLYVAELRDHGDAEAALSRISPNLDGLLAEVDAAEIISSLQEAKSAMNDALPLGAYLFWSLQFNLLEQQVQQIALGRLIQEKSEPAIQDYVKMMYPDSDDAQTLRCQRDQSYLLTMAASALRSLGPTVALQNILKAYVEYVLPYLKNSSLELSHNWAYYENRFMSDLSPCMHSAARSLFGQMADAFGRSHKLQQFVAEMLPAISQDLAQDYALRPYEVEDFMTSICGASLGGSELGLSLLERVLLGTNLANNLSTEACDSLFSGLESVLESKSDGRLPNLLKSVVMELPAANERIGQAAAASGSSLLRFCIANPHAQKSPATWKSCIFARYSRENRSVEPDRNDALVARAFGLGLPEEEAVGKELVGYKRFISNLATASYPPVQEAKRGGLLGLFGGAKKEEDLIEWRGNSTMRKAAEESFQQLVEASLFGFYKLDWLHLLQEVQKKASDLSDARACQELHQALLDGLAKEQGSTHPFIQVIRAYVEQLPALLAAQKLVQSRELGQQYFGLYLAGLRTANHGTVYLRGRQPDSEAAAAEQVIGASQGEKIRSVSAEISELVG